ncbi:hypothetical protein WIS52_28590 [Pseudonocardia nematodicida]|uniref:DUF3618 domain-containing protein n=1 Tax=Pseudonocardia nematodicida TaxID=1206997 RepID=A0ABV1KKQ2_9PSEU
MRRDDDSGSEPLDLSDVSAAELRDRLVARSDGRDDQVVRAAVELRRSLDRLAAGIAARRAALVSRAAELGRAAVPYVGGAVAAGAGAFVVARHRRRPRVLPPEARPVRLRRSAGRPARA